MTESPTVALQIEANLGYSADQIDTHMTIAELIERLEDAQEEYGGEAVLVIHQTNNRYGASFGRIEAFADTLLPAEQVSEVDDR